MLVWLISLNRTGPTRFLILNFAGNLTFKNSKSPRSKVKVEKPFGKTRPSRTRREGGEEVAQAAQGVAQPSEARQGYQEGYRRFRRKEAIKTFVACVYQKPILLIFWFKLLIPWFLFRLVRTLKTIRHGHWYPPQQGKLQEAPTPWRPSLRGCLPWSSRQGLPLLGPPYRLQLQQGLVVLSTTVCPRNSALEKFDKIR